MFSAFGKRYLIIFFILSLIVPVYYIFIDPLQNKILTIGNDELYYFAGMKSVLWDFKDPFLFYDTTVFNDPFVGSPYLSVFIGLAFLLTSADVAVIMITMKFLLLFVHLIVIYLIFEHFLKDGKNLAMFFYITLGGIGGFVFLLFMGNLPPPYTSAFLFNGVSDPDLAFYHITSLTFGYLSFLLFLKKKNILLSATFLGIALLVYPIFGFGFLVFYSVYLFLTKNADIFKIAGISLLFGVPLVIGYIQYPFIFNLLGSQRNYINPMAFFVQFFFMLVFSVYFIVKFYKPKKTISDDFSVISLILILILALLPPQAGFTNPQRYIWMLPFVLSLVGTNGIKYFKNNRNSSIIFILIIFISSLTFIFGHAVAFRDAINVQYSCCNRIEQSELDALIFLRDRDFGNVLTSQRLAIFVPYFSEKRTHDSLFFGSNPFFADLEKAYKDSSGKALLDLVDKYELKYALFPKNESIIPLIAENGGNKIFENDAVFIYEF